MRRLTDVASNDNGDLLDDVARRLLVVARRGLNEPSFETLERSLLAVSNEALRRALESALTDISMLDEEMAEVDVDGDVYRRHERGSAKYHSLCGPISIQRYTYRLVGVRNGPTIVPFELRAGLIERATPALAFAITQGYGKRRFAAFARTSKRPIARHPRGQRWSGWRRRLAPR